MPYYILRIALEKQNNPTASIPCMPITNIYKFLFISNIHIKNATNSSIFSTKFLSFLAKTTKTSKSKNSSKFN